MPISPQEAAQALQDIQASEARSQTLQAYRLSAPHLLIWGVIWFFGYGLTAILPAEQAAWVWPVLGTLGAVVSTVVGRRLGRADNARRVQWLLLALVVFVGATFAVFAPVSPRQSAAFFPLMVALAYVVMGLWGGARLVLAGALLAALTLFGYFALGDGFFAWMAVVGSSALILIGLWLRKV